MGCRCCICQVECRQTNDIEGFLCETHWLRVSADTREAFRRAVKNYDRVRRVYGWADAPPRERAWGEMADAMSACKDEARASLNLEDAVPWGSEHRSLKPTKRPLYTRSTDAPAPPSKNLPPDDILAAC